MTFKTRYVFVVSMDVAPDKEDLFNEVYDTEHVPALMKVPGVVAVSRAKKRAFDLSIGGEIKHVDPAAEPTYTAVYEIESPGVMTSDAWAAAVEEGRWPGEVRPHTSNRRHVLMEVTGSTD